MIFIQSSNEDFSTNEVLDWLYYIGTQKKIRLNGNAEIQNLTCFIGDSFNQSSIKFKNKKNIRFKDIESVWYRRGALKIMNNLINTINDVNVVKHIESYYNSQNKQILNYVYNYVLKNSLNKFPDTKISKIDMLHFAYSLGLKIPETIISNSLIDILKFAKKKKQIIIKPIIFPSIQTKFGNLFVQLNIKPQKKSYEELVAEYSKQIKTTGYSFVQEYIEKQYEIRSFFIDGHFFSMAIFSQSNENTKVDFRNYDAGPPNRCIPYILPVDIEEKLSKLMKKLSMNCGSFDIICTPNDNFIFLEVNPTGHYDWLTKNCNYFIDRIMAKRLLNEKR